MPPIHLRCERSHNENDGIEGIDLEGCGGYLPPSNQLDSLVLDYLSKTSMKVRDIKSPDDRGVSKSSWRKGKMEIRVTYMQINDDADWPSDYPQRETLHVMICGKQTNPKFVADIGRLVNGYKLHSLANNH